MKSATLAIRPLTGTGLALAMLTAAAPTPAGAQTDTGAVLRDVVLKGRLKRVLDRLDALFADDRKAAEGAPISDTKAAALRREIQRLVLRARTTGLPLDAVAAALRAAASERFEGAVPGAFATEAGELDARALIRGIVGQTRVSGAAKADNSYLSAITEEGSSTKIGKRQAPVKEPPPKKATTTDETAEKKKEDKPKAAAAELENEAERTERLGTKKRVVTVDRKRYLVVKSGDTLGSITRDVYGNILLYRRIYEANRDKLSNPNVVTLGTRLVLP